MAILHVSWVPQAQQFFFWAEAWQPLPAEGLDAWAGLHLHPYALGQTDMAQVLATLQKQLVGRATSSTDVFPAALTEAAVASGKRVAKATGGSRRSRSAKSAARGVTGPTWGEIALPLPARLQDTALAPVHSAKLEAQPEAEPDADTLLHPWRVQGWQLSITDFLPTLLALPLGQHTLTGLSEIGPDLRYWGHIARWSLNLLARGKFLPDLE
ncbi:MAG: ATP-dependent helicase, partial [Nodosilinea sp.]